MIKVLQINSTLNWGGTGFVAEHIGQFVNEKGGDSYIAYGRYGNPTKSKSIKIGNKWDVYFHVLQTRIFDRHGLASQRATHKLIHKIKNINPDIIHLHNIHGYYVNYPILFDYLFSSGKPVIWTLHDCWAFTGHCSHYSCVKCYRWQENCQNCCQKEYYPKSLFHDRSSLNYLEKKKFFTSIKNMVIVPVSDWLKEEVKKSFLNKYKTKRIYNGIDLNLFKPGGISSNKLKLLNKFIILGVASIWDEKKGMNDFVKLSQKIPNDFQILLIGLTEKQKLKLPKEIIGILRTNSLTELAEYYSYADVYINFSVEESFGLTTCEAMACGTPVIVYDTTACSEMVSADTGFIVEQGNMEGVVYAIKQIKSVGKVAYTQACRERAVKHFNKEDRCAEYLQLYKEILNKK